MPEPVNITAAVSAWLLKKGADSAWGRIYRYFRPKVLCIQIESALGSDAAVAEVCQPAPTLDRGRLTDDRAKGLLKTAITGDVQALSSYLLNEQLIDLPQCPDKKPPSYEAVWNCVASAVQHAVCTAVAKDEELSRQFLEVSQQLSHVEHQQIQTTLLAFIAQSQQTGELVLEKLDAIEGRLPEQSLTVALSDAAALRSVNLLSQENERLEQELREQLDRNTERLWDGILKEFQRGNFRDAIAKGQELADWLTLQGTKLSTSARGRAFLLLSQVALIESSDLGDRQDGYSKAKDLFEKARRAFGDVIQHENVVRLTNFRAKLLFVDGQHDVALSTLDDATDPQSVATRLSIYIDQDEAEKGVGLVQCLPLDEQWCELAVFVHARTGNDGEARKVLHWAHASDNRSLDERCRVAYARATLTRLMDQPGERPLSLLSIDGAIACQVGEVLEQLKPITEACRARAKVENGVEADAVGLAYTCRRMLHQPAEARSCITLLHDFCPVHLDYAYAAMRGDVDMEPGLADQIRAQYPNFFAAQHLALGIDCLAGTASSVLDHVAATVCLAKTENERTRLARAVVQASWDGDADMHPRAEALIVQLVGKNHFLTRLLEAHRYFRGGDMEGFERALKDLEGEDDFSVEQSRAQLRLMKREYAQAAEILEVVGRRIAEPELLRDAARIATRATPIRLDIVIRALEDVLTLSPTDVEANQHLASAYVQLRVFASAAACFQRLRRVGAGPISARPKPSEMPRPRQPRSKRTGHSGRTLRESRRATACPLGPRRPFE